MDAELLNIIETAWAARQARVTAPGYVEPEPYRSPPKPKPGPPPMEAMTVEKAFTNLIKANATLMRARDPVTADVVRQVWEEYRWAYAHWHNHKIPAEKIAEFGLSMLQLRDLFSNAGKFIKGRNHPRSKPTERRNCDMNSFGEIFKSLSTPVEQTSSAEPFSLFVKNAEDKAGHVVSARTLKSNAEEFLKKNGYANVEQHDETELRRLRAVEIDARKYPRTYL